MAKQNKGRKFFAASATAALVASAIVPVASAAQVNDYNKISGYAKEAVQSLVDAGVIQGDTNGNFNPLNTVTRAQAAEIFTKALELEADGDVNFSDVKKGAWYYNSIAAVVANGIFEGVSANEFAPNKSLTRSEAAKVLVDAFGLEGSESLSQFADASQVKPWAKDALETAVANGIFTGSEENGKLNLKPNAAITRQDFAVVFARTLDLAVETVDASVKAINATTVEVTFEEVVDADNLKASDFKIEGLEITNAAVKQTNKKVVVLTTATQTADKEYVLTKNGEEIGKFKGISAVIPTAIKLTTPSVQGTIGKQATVSAEVTVPEGQSKAGIPVTFNIVSDTNSNLNEKVEVVAYTDEKGVASYSYTRYYKHNDSVTAYATDKSTVYASGKVYWAEGLTITEVTTGNELANGAKKVYKIKTDLSLTETNGTSATTDDYKYVNVAFLENVDVTPDKLVRDVEVIDTGVASTSTYTQAKYPSQVTTGGIQTVRVKVNADGEATFTLTGSNATVTPIVFVDNTSNTTGKYTKTALQASAPAVKFALSHTLGLTVKAEGVQNAAAINAKGTGQGGRTYTVTVTDKEGKVAPEGTVAYVTFADGALSKDRAENVHALNADGEIEKSYTNVQTDQIIPVKVYGSKGEAKFLITADKDGFATPTVFVDNGSTTGKLDKNDLQTVGETTYFVDAVITNSKLEAKVKNKVVTSTSGSNTVDFIYSSVDQNGNKYAAATSNYEVSYEVTAQFVDVYAGTTLIKKGTTQTVKVNAINGVATLPISSADSTVASQVTVNASASQVSLPNQKASVNFTPSNALPATYTGNATYDSAKEEITFDGYKAVSYANATYKDLRAVSKTLSKSDFEVLLKADKDLNKYSNVTAIRDANGNYTFEYLGSGTLMPVAAVPTDGVVAFQNPSFNATAAQTITVTDADLNINPAVAETTTVTVSGPGASFNITLTETGPTTGVFQATISPAQLGLFTDGTLTATYKDVYNTSGVAKDRTATATLNTVAGAFTVANAGAPIVAYSPAAPTAAKVTGAQAGTALGAGDLTIKVDNTNLVVTIAANAGPITEAQAAKEVVDAINAESVTAGLGNIATLDTDKVVLTSPTTGVTSSVEVVNVGTTTGTGLTVAPVTNGNAGNPIKAKWSFTLSSNVGVGEKVTVKLGSKTVVLTEGVDFNRGLTAEATAAAITAELDDAATGLVGYAVTNTVGSNVIVVEQDSAAATSASDVLTASVSK